jgi:hypothetical protein
MVTVCISEDGDVVGYAEKTDHDILPIDFFLLIHNFNVAFTFGSVDKGLKESRLLAEMLCICGVRKPRSICDGLRHHAVVPPAHDERADNDGGGYAEEKDKGRCGR